MTPARIIHLMDMYQEKPGSAWKKDRATHLLDANTARQGIFDTLQSASGSTSKTRRIDCGIFSLDSVDIHRRAVLG